MANGSATNCLPPSVGTILKVNVTADIGNDLHLSDVDFSCTFYKDGYVSKKILVEKANMIYIDADNYLAVVDTNAIGAGTYFCRLEVKIPDANVSGGIRTEVVRFPVEGAKVVN